jgi:isopenicillin-N epimerase
LGSEGRAAGAAHGLGAGTAHGQGAGTAPGQGGATASGAGSATGQGNGGSVTIQGIEVSWDRVAELFPLDPGIAYLNHGAFGVCPEPVRRAQQRLRDEMEANPTAFFTRGLYDRLAHTRRHVAAFLGADPDGSALIPNASAATQIVFNTLGLAAGDEVLLTTHTYGTVRLAAGRAGLRVVDAHFPVGATDD